VVRSQAWTAPLYWPFVHFQAPQFCLGPRRFGPPFNLPRHLGERVDIRRLVGKGGG